jgi:cytochrome c biogenesis protein CcdA
MMVDLGTRQGRSVWDSLNLTDLPPVMVITYNAERTVLKEITKGNLEEILDALLGGKPPPAEPTDASAYSLFTAFSLGFFDTFSPCLIAMLSFTLSYTIGKTSRFKEGFFRVMTFGIGFVSAAVLLGAAVAFMIIFLPSIQIVLLWIMCIFAILLGLNLLNLLSLPIQTKPLIRKLAARHAAMYLGIFLLGFIFYFLDPCIAPFAFTMLMMLQNSEFLLPLLMFCLGAIIPFVAIGILAGYVSKLARITYKHRSKIRAVSGLILIVYALYLIIFYLF